MSVLAKAAAARGASSRAASYLALAKPRIVAAVLVTTAVGYYLGEAGSPSPSVLLGVLAGTGLAAAGALALNQYFERDIDACMRRTCRRPLPGGRLRGGEALGFGAVTTGVGIGALLWTAGWLAAVLTCAVVACYLCVYTPLKRVTPLSSLAGAVPGALPPVIGWVAAAGGVDAGAWVLFAIVFLWQIPHTLAIGRLYRGDYLRAGLRILPAVDRDGTGTGALVVASCLGLLPVALMPTLLGLTGAAYFVAALALGLGLLAGGVGLAATFAAAEARRLLLASLVYLPLLFGMMALDKLG